LGFVPHGGGQVTALGVKTPPRLAQSVAVTPTMQLLAAAVVRQHAPVMVTQSAGQAAAPG